MQARQFKSVMSLLLFITFNIGIFAFATNSHSQSATYGNVESSPVRRAILLSSDGGTRTFFGAPVAVDGDTIVVAAPMSQEAYVFVKPPNGWQNATETARLSPSIGGSIGFGSSVAISADTIIVAAPHAGNVHGIVFVYVKPPQGWTDMTETAQLTASDVGDYDAFGIAIGISNDTIVGTSQWAARAYVYAKPPAGWTNMTETAELGDEDATDFGVSVAISGDNVIVGSSGCCIEGEPVPGRASIFVKPQSGWASTFTPDAVLTGSDETNDDNFGEAIVYRNDTVVVGSDHNAGAAYVFIQPPGGWTSMTENAELTSTDSRPNDFFAHAVATNGEIVAVGAPEWNDHSGVRGDVYIYDQPKSGWKTTSKANTQIFSPPAQNECELGQGLSMNETTLAVGCPGALVNNHQYQGAVLVLSK